jgi:alkylhydroperoxidase family enzyme
VSAKTLAALQTDVDAVEAPAQERALLKLAAVVTREPARAANAVQEALGAGCPPEQVRDAVFLVSAYNMVNRVADSYAYPPDPVHPYDPEAEIPVLSCPEKAAGEVPQP